MSSVAFAFDILPEYQGLSESELSRFERPADLDSEYQTLLNAYSTSAEWDRQWQDQPRVMDLTVGSLSNTVFLQYSRLKVETQLLESLRFRFIYFAQQDRELDQSRHILELIQRLTPWLNVSLYGEPSLYKRENAAGLALETGSNTAWQNRIYYTLHDISRAEHNDQPDYFDKWRSPRSMGWTGILRGRESQIRMGFRYDQPVTWVRPQEQRVFNYEKKLVFSDFSWNQSARRLFALRLQWDFTFKGQTPDSSTSPVVAENWKNKRLLGRFSFQNGLPSDPLTYEGVFTHAVRDWTNQNGQYVQHLNDMIAVNVIWRGIQRAGSYDHIRLGYEVTLFHTYGDIVLTPPQQKHDSVEQRLQTGYEFSFQSNARLLLALNFDLDEWTPVPTFEGGNCQFRADF